MITEVLRFQKLFGFWQLSGLIFRSKKCIDNCAESDCGRKWAKIEVQIQSIAL